MPHYKSWVRDIGGNWNWTSLPWHIEPYNPHPPVGGEVIIARIVANTTLNVNASFLGTQKLRWMLSPDTPSYPDYIYDTYLDLTINPHYFESYPWEYSRFEMLLLCDNKPLAIMCRKIQIVPVSCTYSTLKFNLTRSPSRSVVLVVPPEEYFSFQPHSVYEFDFLTIETKLSPADIVNNPSYPIFRLLLSPDRNTDSYFLLAFALELPSSSSSSTTYGLLSEDKSTWNLITGGISDSLIIKDTLSLSDVSTNAKLGGSVLVQLLSPLTQGFETIDYFMRIGNFLISENSDMSQVGQVNYAATFRAKENTTLGDTPIVRMLGELLLKTETSINTGSFDSADLTRKLNVVSRFDIGSTLWETSLLGSLTLKEDFTLFSAQAVPVTYLTNIQDINTLMQANLPPVQGVLVKDESAFSLQGVTSLPMQGSSTIRHRFNVSSADRVAAIFPLQVIDTSEFNLVSTEWELWKNLSIFDVSTLVQMENIQFLPLLDVVDTLDFMWEQDRPTSLGNSPLRVVETSTISQHSTNLFKLFIYHTTSSTPIGGTVDYISAHTLRIGELSYMRVEDATKIHYTQSVVENYTSSASASTTTYIHHILFSEHYTLQQDNDSVKEQTTLMLVDEVRANDFDTIAISGGVVVHDVMPPHQDAAHAFIWQLHEDVGDAEGPTAI